MTQDKGIFIKNVFYMLTYAFQELSGNNYASMAVESFDGIQDLFAEILTRGVAAQLKRGLHRRYVEQTGALATLRGKPLIGATLRHKANGRQRIECEFDEYSPDNLLNRIINSTLRLLLRSTEVKRERKGAIRNIMPYFDRIGEVNLREVKWTSLRFDRNAGIYRMLIYICYFIVSDLLLSTEEGKYRQESFMEERMCRLFEKFVLEYYKRHHPECNPTAKRIEWNLEKTVATAEILPILQTDVVLTIGDRTLIIDTKYYGKTLQEHYDKKTIISHNQNQIFTYVVNHDANHEGKTDGMLLYAKTREEIQPDDMIQLKDGNRIFYKTLDLNRDFEGIKIQLERIIGLVDNMKK